MATLTQIVEIELLSRQGLAGPPGPEGPATGGGAIPLTVRNTTTPGAANPSSGDVLEAVLAAGWYGSLQWRRGAPGDASAGAGPVVGADASAYTVTPLDVAVGLDLWVVFGTDPAFAASAGRPIGDGAPDNTVTVDGEPITVDGAFVTV